MTEKLVRRKIREKKSFEPVVKLSVFVAYCLLGISYSAVLLIEGVSECNNRIRALNEPCGFQSDVPRSLIQTYAETDFCS